MQIKGQPGSLELPYMQDPGRRLIIVRILWLIYVAVEVDH